MTIGKRARGFTMVEMIITIVVVGIIFVLGGMVLGKAFQSFELTQRSTDVDWQGRVAMERMARELRQIHSPTATSLDITSAVQVRFIDIDGSGVCFYRDGATSQLMRSTSGLALACNAVAANPQPLADNVVAVNFDYYQSDGSVAGGSTVVYYISVRLQVTEGSITETYRTTVQPERF